MLQQKLALISLKENFIINFIVTWENFTMDHESFYWRDNDARQVLGTHRQLKQCAPTNTGPPT